jgi:hypothetical protein
MINKARMKNGWIFLLFFASSLGLRGQGASSSTISAAGANGLVQGKYYSHVIGQASVVAGTSVRNGVAVRQGFKQPNLLARSIQKSGLKIQIADENPIRYQVFPNPFVEQLTIKFSEQSSSPTFVAMYSITGQVVWESTYPAKISEINLLDFTQFKTGKYILHVLYKGKPYVEAVIKE